MSIVEQTRETPVVPVTRREVLHRAADLLEEFGWCQFTLAQDAQGNGFGGFGGAPWGLALLDSRWTRFCARGAIVRAEFELGLRQVLPEPISRFNNAPGRTKSEVVARLRQAAEAA